MNLALSVLMSWISLHVQSACYPKLRGPSHWWAKAWTWADWGALRGLRPCLFLFFFSNCNQRSFEWYCVIRVSSFCSLYGARLCTLRNTVFLNFWICAPLNTPERRLLACLLKARVPEKVWLMDSWNVKLFRSLRILIHFRQCQRKLRTENGMIWV